MITRSLRLRDRILAWYGGTVLAVLALVLALVQLRVNAEAGRLLQSKMDITLRVVESLRRDRTATLAIMARLAGEEPRLGNAMTTQHPPTIEDLLKRDIAPGLEADFIQVTDPHGKVLADTSGRVKAQVDLSQDSVVREALAGRTWRGMLILPGEIYLAASAPIHAGGQELGTVTVGRRVDDQVARQLRHETESEVTLFAGTELAASSWPHDRRHQLLAAVGTTPEARDLVGALPASGKTVPRRSFPMTVAGRRLMCLLIPLEGQDGSEGRLLIQSDMDAVLQPYENIRSGLAAVGVLGLLAALLGSIIVSSGIAEPLRRIAQAAHALSQGDWRQRTPVTTRDEVGLLAETFNRMAERLESWDSDLRAAVADRTRELDAAVARLNEAFQQMRRFNADASHELRTPLTVIRGEAEVALRSPRSPAEYQAVLRSIEEETERMSRIIEHLLLLARADSGELRLERRPLALDDVVREMAHRAEVLARARGIRLKVEGLEPILFDGDEDRLRQLTLNLIDNAIKYTLEGGEVRVRLARTPGDDAASAGAVLEVEDTGIGIDATDLPHIFERFYRVDRARSRAQGGTGLGLAISQWIVEAHGGRIEVRSTPGAGSTFRVWLPGARVPSMDGSQPAFVEEERDSPTITGGGPQGPPPGAGVSQTIETAGRRDG